MRVEKLHFYVRSGFLMCSRCVLNSHPESFQRILNLHFNDRVWFADKFHCISVHKCSYKVDIIIEKTLRLKQLTELWIGNEIDLKEKVDIKAWHQFFQYI